LAYSARMTFGSRASRTAYFLPLWWLVSAGFLTWIACRQAQQEPGADLVFMVLVLGFLLLRTLDGIRILRTRDGLVLVQGVFRSASLDAATCCFATSVSKLRDVGYGVDVVAADREHKIKLATTYSKAGGEHLAAWLGQTLLDREPGGALPAAIAAGMEDELPDRRTAPQEGEPRRGGHKATFLKGGLGVSIGIALYLVAIAVYSLLTNPQP
jgi:hypothetical protein